MSWDGSEKSSWFQLDFSKCSDRLLKNNNNNNNNGSMSVTLYPTQHKQDSRHPQMSVSVLRGLIEIVPSELDIELTTSDRMHRILSWRCISAKLSFYKKIQRWNEFNPVFPLVIHPVELFRCNLEPSVAPMIIDIYRPSHLSDKTKNDRKSKGQLTLDKSSFLKKQLSGNEPLHTPPRWGLWCPLAIG